MDAGDIQSFHRTLRDQLSDSVIQAIFPDGSGFVPCIGDDDMQAVGKIAGQFLRVLWGCYRVDLARDDQGRDLHHRHLMKIGGMFSPDPPIAGIFLLIQAI